MKITLKELKELVGEIIAESKQEYETYHETYGSAIREALTYAEKRGYEYDQEEVSSEVSFNTKRPSLGKNVKISISLYKNGKLQKKALQIIISRISENTYELVSYIF